MNYYLFPAYVTHTHTHTHTHKHTRRADRKDSIIKLDTVRLKVLEQPYAPIVSTPISILVYVQVNRESMLLYIQESRGSNPEQ
jgi:hypothetical protein